METLFLSATEEGIARAAETIRNGGLCALPTETVYGLGANGFDPQAVTHIFAAKGRPQDNPLILHIADWSMLEELAQEIPPLAKTLADAFWPGPLTMIVKRKPCVPDVVTAGLDTVAIRMPAHPVMREVILKAGVPIAAPSANRSGKPSPTTAKHVLDDLNGRVDLILDGGACDIGLESTIVNLASNPPALLRPGGITLEQLQHFAPDITVDPSLLGATTERPLAPGMKYRHYAPEGATTVVRGDKASVVAYIKDAIRTADGKTGILAPDGYFADADADLVLSLGSSAATAAQRLFAALRTFDDAKVEHIFAVDSTTDGIGLALCNRLYKAAGFRIIDLRPKLLFVCTGNTCRSPMAEAYAKTVLGVSADSCGLAASAGAPASDHAVSVAKERGLDLSQHHAKPLTAEAVENADRIYTMSYAHAEVLERVFPQHRNKLRVMGISDPFGGDEATYRRCLNEMIAYLENEPWN